jgi:hypothetical protein
MKDATRNHISVGSSSRAILCRVVAYDEGRAG